MSQESDVCCTTAMSDIQNQCIWDEINLFYFTTCIITHNNNVIEQNIDVSTFDILSVKKTYTELYWNVYKTDHLFFNGRKIFLLSNRLSLNQFHQQ